MSIDTNRTSTIIDLRLNHGLSLGMIGKRFNISRERVRQIIAETRMTTPELQYKQDQLQLLIKTRKAPEFKLKRQQDIKELRNQGLTYQAIGNRYNLTRERVRQIINSTLE